MGVRLDKGTNLVLWALELTRKPGIEGVRLDKETNLVLWALDLTRKQTWYCEI